jgi:hypothetical protein
MTKKQLEDLKKWFFNYVSGYYNNNPQNNEDIKLKEDHTKRMCVDTPIITKELGFNQEQSLLAEAISLLHDTGRFEQYKKYGTYNDVGTENHSLIGLKVLADQKVLDGLDGSEKNIIETAIRFHGVKDLPKNLDKDVEPFARLVRDIDKLDIFYIMLAKVDDLRANPEKCFTIFGYPPDGKCSQHIIDAVLNGRTISYHEFKSLNDMILGLLGWIYDINFPATLKEIKKRSLMEKLISYLPESDEIRKLSKHILDVLDKRIINNK